MKVYVGEGGETFCRLLSLIKWNNGQNSKFSKAWTISWKNFKVYVEERGKTFNWVTFCQKESYYYNKGNTYP